MGEKARLSELVRVMVKESEQLLPGPNGRNMRHQLREAATACIQAWPAPIDQAWLYVVVARTYTGSVAKAIESYETALDLANDGKLSAELKVVVLSSLYELYTATGQTEKADETMLSVVAICPEALIEKLTKDGPALVAGIVGGAIGRLGRMLNQTGQDLAALIGSFLEPTSDKKPKG